MRSTAILNAARHHCHARPTRRDINENPAQSPGSRNATAWPARPGPARLGASIPAGSLRGMLPGPMASRAGVRVGSGPCPGSSGLVDVPVAPSPSKSDPNSAVTRPRPRNRRICTRGIPECRLGASTATQHPGLWRVRPCCQWHPPSGRGVYTFKGKHLDRPGSFGLTPALAPCERFVTSLPTTSKSRSTRLGIVYFYCDLRSFCRCQ